MLTDVLFLPGLLIFMFIFVNLDRNTKRQLETGTRAAAAGGFTSVCCMANTDPVNDDPSITHSILETARRTASVKVYPIGAVTKGLAGKELAEIGLLKEAGCVAFSDDGKR